MAYSLHTFSLLDAVDVAADTGRDLLECAELLYALSAHLDFDHLLTVGHRAGTRRPLARAGPAGAARRPVPVAAAADRGRAVHHVAATRTRSARSSSGRSENASRLARARRTLGEIAAVSGGDLAALSVAAREIRSMIR